MTYKMDIKELLLNNFRINIVFQPLKICKDKFVKLQKQHVIENKIYVLAP